MAKRLDFSLEFSLNFSTTHISATHVSEKYLPSHIFARFTRRYCACFHSTCSTRWPDGSIFTEQQFFCSICLTKINFTQHHSTPLDSLNKVAKRLDFFLDFLSSTKSSEKLSRLARALHGYRKPSNWSPLGLIYFLDFVHGGIFEGGVFERA